MKLMPCPLNGLRNISEFAYGGELTDMPAPDADEATWADYLFYRDNAAGVVREWWCHTATSYWFIAERSTVTDEILRTYPPDEIYQQRQDFSASPTTADTAAPAPTPQAVPPAHSDEGAAT